MLKRKLTFILLFSSIVTMAQDKAKIAGVYSLGSSSPEGGSNLIVLDDGHYVVTYFGGIQAGKWQAIDDGRYEFVPLKRESSFALYGRHNKTLADSSRIFFAGFEATRTYFQFKTTGKDANELQAVFNKDANCFSFPYATTKVGIARELNFVHLPYNQKQTDQLVKSFKNLESYNDFAVYFTQVDANEARSFRATFTDNALSLSDGSTVNRIAMQINEEDFRFITGFIDSQSREKEAVYLNAAYNSLYSSEDFVMATKGQITNTHRFDQQRNAYIAKYLMPEELKNQNLEKDFDDMSVIYRYQALKTTDIPAIYFKLLESSIFTVLCD